MIKENSIYLITMKPSLRYLDIIAQLYFIFVIYEHNPGVKWKNCLCCHFVFFIKGPNPPKILFP